MEALKQKVDQVFAEWDSTVSPGCAVAIVKDGEIIYKRGYGMANLEYDVPIRPDTIFHIASISKQFAALAVTLLDHEGKLSLDDEVSKYVAEMPDFGEKITIRHLVHHTSGLRDQWEMAILAGWRMDDVISTDDVLELLSGQTELNFKPGEKFLYCNTGYTLLAVLVEKVTGQTLREFCQDRIFKPLGMKRTHFHDDHNFIVPGRAYSYSPTAEGFQKSVLSYATVGATSLFTTVEDLALWDEEFYQGAVLGKEVIEAMRSRGVLNNGEQIRYAHGLMLGKYRGLRHIGHGGADAGFRSHLMRFPDEHLSFIVFANMGTISPSILCEKLADIYLEDKFSEAAQEIGEPLQMPIEQLEKFAGLYFSDETRSSYILKLEGGKLAVQYGSTLLNLQPYSESLFRLEIMPSATLEFSQKDGQLELILKTGEIAEKFIKIDQHKPEMNDLKKLTGQYWSPELDVKFTVQMNEKGLLLKRRKYGESHLLPTVKYGFTGSTLIGYDLFFEVDAQGEASSFRINSGRIKNLLFEKIE